MKIVAINGSPRKNATPPRGWRRSGGSGGRRRGVPGVPARREGPPLYGLLPLPEHRQPPVRPDRRHGQRHHRRLHRADGILLAAPVYHGGISGNMKCVLDRLMLSAGCGVNQLHHKVGGALCTLRRSGGMETYQQLLGTMDAMEMVIVTSDYWGGRPRRGPRRGPEGRGGHGGGRPPGPQHGLDGEGAGGEQGTRAGEHAPPHDELHPLSDFRPPCGRRFPPAPRSVRQTDQAAPTWGRLVFLSLENVRVPELDGLGKVFRADGLRPVQVRDGPGHPQDAVVGTGR